MSKTKVLAIILHWNDYEDTIDCVESLFDSKWKNLEILIVDNNSIGDEAERLQKKFPTIKIIRNKKNLGFAGGNNIGIRNALKNDSSFIFLLNNDAKVKKNCIPELIKKVNNPTTGIAVPKIYNQGTKKIQSCGDYFNKKLGLSLHLKKNSKQAFEVNAASGAAMMIKLDVIEKVGLFDEKFFAYYEDLDLCLRMKNKGYKILAVPSAEAEHKLSSSTNGSLVKTYFKIRNVNYLMKKHGLGGLLFDLSLYFILIPNEFRRHLDKPLKCLKTIRKALADSEKISLH